MVGPSWPCKSFFLFSDFLKLLQFHISQIGLTSAASVYFLVIVPVFVHLTRKLIHFN